MEIRKSHALRLWTTSLGIAKAVGITASAVSYWKESLTPVQRDRIISAAYRGGKIEQLENIVKQPKAKDKPDSISNE